MIKFSELEIIWKWTWPVSGYYPGFRS